MKTMRAIPKLGLGVAGTLFAFNALNTFNPVYLENLKSVIVDNSIDAFPLKLKDYSLVGHGVRSVTFLGFKVYGAGIYLKDADKSSVLKLLKQEQNLDEAFNDNDKSFDLVSKLWEAADFKIRICPVRNTDFSHLRDGFVKSILSHPLSKKNPEVAAGLDELKAVFKGHKGSVPKNHILLLSIDKGKLTFTYENTSNGDSKVLGTVNEPQVSKLLLVSYLTKRKPLSEPLRSNCAQGFKELAN